MADANFPKIVSDKCERTGPKAEICIECVDLNQAYDKGTREMVLQHATSLGLSRPGFSGGCSTEWVNGAGETLHGEAFRNASDRRVRAYYPIQEGL